MTVLRKKFVKILKNQLLMEEFKKKKVIEKRIFFNLNLTLKIFDDFFLVIENKIFLIIFLIIYN
tara:strand:+ start:14021 stop:14212 length:192 start_codon:yes stop_codon:yes gene_type:complete